MSESELFPLDRIATEGTQARVALSETIIHEYAEALKQGDEFPPIEVYFDDTTYWLGDGFHRVQAAKEAGLNALAATVHPGGQREALLHALGANETHGLRRTDADRRHAVVLMLHDPDWHTWSDREIARQCHVSHMLVNRVRREITPPEQQRAPEGTRKARRGGQVYPIDTRRIGTSKKKAQEQPPVGDTGQPAIQPPVVEPPAPAMPDVPPTETPSVTPLQMDPHASAMAVRQEPAVTSVEPPQEHAEHGEETPAIPALPTEPADIAHQEPVIPPPPPPPTLTGLWQQASVEERQAFVAAHLDDLRALMAAHEEPPPKKRATTSPHTARPQLKQKQRPRAASKRA